MSAETPRTDEAAVGFARLLVDKETFTVTELVDANFARVLERELAAAQSDLARLAQSNAELREALRQVIAGADGSPTHGSLAEIARRALSNEGE